jgi:competence protein ComEC
MHVKFRLLVILTLTVALTLAGCGTTDGPSDQASAPPAATVAPTATEPDPTETATDAMATVAPAPADAPGMTLTAINIGYGDAILIQLDSQDFLIDTGQKKAGAQLLRALAACGVKRLDGVFLTHPHSDHIGGMKMVAQYCDIGSIYTADIALDKDKINELAADLGITLQRLSAGDTVPTDSGAVFEVLGPVVLNKDDDNDNSLVMRIKAGGLVWLLTGDMQFAEESSLMNAGVDFQADVLKVGNHGNPDATSDTFGKVVSPQAAVISTSTQEDDDSANARVINALGGADIYVTQDYTLGVALTAEGGKLTMADIVPQPAAGTVKLSYSTHDQTTTLTSDADMDLSGWFIWSVKGNELFVFPEGAAIKAGVPLVVTCTGGAGDYIWNDKKVWSDKADEAGVLYTSSGAEAARSEY